MSGADSLQDIDRRVNDLKTQILNFGPEFSLSIPDADDVKGAFGLMTSVILRQQNELNALHSSMKRMSDDFLRSQKEILQWTKRNMEDLKADNRSMKSKLDQFRDKIDIFSYNLQGYDADDRSVEVLTDGNAISNIRSVEILPGISRIEDPPDINIEIPPMLVNSAPVATPTRRPSGGVNPILDDDLPDSMRKKSGTIEESILNILSHDLKDHPLPELEQLKETDSEDDVDDLLMLPPLGDDIILAKAEEMATNRLMIPRMWDAKSPERKHSDRRASNLESIEEALIEYNRDLSARTKQRARARWSWAFEKVLFIVRLRINKKSLAKVRLPKGQALITRIERLENHIFNIHKDIETKIVDVPKRVKEMVKSDPEMTILLQKALNGTTSNLDPAAIMPEFIKEHEDMLIRLNDLTDFLKAQVGEVRQSVVDSNVDYNNKIQELKEEEMQLLETLKQHTRFSPEMEQKLINLVTHMDDGTKMKNIVYNSMVHDLLLKMNALEADADVNEQQILALSHSEILETLDTEESIHKILKNDTDLREARGQLLVIDSTIHSMKTMVANVRHDLTALEETGNVPPEDRENFLSLVVECDEFSQRLDIIHGRIKGSYERCRQHDKLVATRWRALGKDGQSHVLEAFSNAMSAFSMELQGRPSMLEVKNAIGDAVQAAVKTMETRMNRMLFKMRIKLVEHETYNEYVQSGGQVPIPDSEEATEEFEGMLEPLISDIVEMYVSRSQEMGGGISTPHQRYSGGASGTGADGEHTGGDPTMNHRGIIPIEALRRLSQLSRRGSKRPGLDSLLGGDGNLNSSEEKSGSTIPTPLHMTRAGRMATRRQQEEAVKQMREDVQHLTDKIEKLFKDRMDVTQIHGMIAMKADAFDLDRKADSRVLETIERSLRKVMEDMGDMNSLRDDELSKLKETLERHVRAKIKILFARIEDNSKPAFLATKSLCLSCSRVSTVKINSEPTASPGFLPALGSASTPGPDVYRGGFRMPVSQRDGLFSSKSARVTDLPDDMDDFEDLRVDAPLVKEEVFIAPPASKQSTRPVTHGNNAPKIVTHAGGREDTQLPKPIHRTGLKGKKSERAAFMAMDRTVDNMIASSPTLAMSQSAAVLPSYGQKPKYLAPVRTSTS